MKDWKYWEQQFADPAHYPAIRDHVLKLNSSYDEISGYTEFRAALTAAADDPDLALPLVKNYFTIDILRKMMHLERTSFCEVSAYAGKFLSVEQGYYNAISLARTPHLIAILVALDRHQLRRHKASKRGRALRMGFTGCRSIIKVFRGQLSLRIWEIDPIDDTTDFTSGCVHARVARDLVLREGDDLALRPFEEFEYLEDCTGALFLNAQMMEGSSPVVAHCHVESGQLSSTSAVGQVPSRLQMLSTLLRTMGRLDAFDTMAELLDDPRHFVRWHAMRELIGLDSERALPHLVRLSRTDPQPAVRRAASRTLHQFFPDTRAA